MFYFEFSLSSLRWVKFFTILSKSNKLVALRQVYCSLMTFHLYSVLLLHVLLFLAARHPHQNQFPFYFLFSLLLRKTRKTFLGFDGLIFLDL